MSVTLGSDWVSVLAVLGLALAIIFVSRTVSLLRVRVLRLEASVRALHMLAHPASGRDDQPSPSKVRRLR